MEEFTKLELLQIMAALDNQIKLKPCDQGWLDLRHKVGVIYANRKNT